MSKLECSVDCTPNGCKVTLPSNSTNSSTLNLDFDNGNEVKIWFNEPMLYSQKEKSLTFEYTLDCTPDGCKLSSSTNSTKWDFDFDDGKEVIFSFNQPFLYYQKQKEKVTSGSSSTFMNNKCSIVLFLLMTSMFF
ncbi:hypothetical protein CANTEDRAFT_115229 [Yamadazyma tenuis ATCC 10573]|uniref:Uncharacterized protein n=1 Tax=Candida tenuis (strain ATCC 10573 / BCRC 21748 / CBS 615 / JCM 9827 / NBRC 10315 / NRRL Y-1498 / VKM Y-70) TaxID=590646 RepID=G3B8V6_CANTC|nr:uncharacterized protein CANTEDRAFT_115229 [Yamadazyma tenuis ATCC 10573]EGV61783.1 hypothetical protein CANTEDRAFT_115229 [Yamadazyma tenuis ATCC 10573]